MASGYAYVWEVQVMPEAVDEFRRLYGTEGPWVELFRRSPGYVGSLLLEDRETPGRYLTVDRWQSEAAFLAFKEQFAQEYADLDLYGQALTSRETPLGTFVDHGNRRVERKTPT
jgi:heme-degrading monooxygenase HmoA